MFEFTPEYKAYIRSPRWKQMCSRYWAVYGKKCQACGTRKNLQVHHKSYDRFGRELLSDLAGVCQTCHLEIHREHRRNKSLTLRLVTERYIALKKKA